MFLKLILFSLIPYSISNWFVWQNLKLGTSLPRGSGSSKNGFSIGWSIKFLYFGCVLAVCLYYGWMYLLSIPVTWIISGWMATLFERKMYMEKVLEHVKWASEYYANTTSSFAIEMTSVPKWWLDLMPQEWKQDYYSIIKRNAE